MRTAKYSWLKAPRWKGNAMEVGPLARMLVGFASGKTEYKDVVTEALGALKVPASGAVLDSRPHRGARPRDAARRALAAGRVRPPDRQPEGRRLRHRRHRRAGSLRTWPAECQGLRLHRSAARRARPLDPHQGRARSTTTRSSCPRPGTLRRKDGKGQHGAYEAALLDTPMADPKRPLEILRTIHSFDPCLACASHVFGPDGRKLAEVKVR